MALHPVALDVVADVLAHPTFGAVVDALRHLRTSLVPTTARYPDARRRERNPRESSTWATGSSPSNIAFADAGTHPLKGIEGEQPYAVADGGGEG
jgi:hypothetical protein